MASVGFGSSVAAVAPASSSAAGRRMRRSQLAVPVAATRGTQSTPKKAEKGILDFIVGAIFKEEQFLVETDPLLNKVDAPPSASGTASRKAGGTTSGGKKPAAGGDAGSGGGFNLGGLFAKKG